MCLALAERQSILPLGFGLEGLYEGKLAGANRSPRFPSVELKYSLEDPGWENTHESQGPGIVMRAGALVVCGVRRSNCEILDDLDAVLHVLFRVVELVQRIGREGEGPGGG